MDIIEIALLGLVVVCGITTCVSKNMMVSLIIFMAYGVIMSIIWALLEAPDLAVTEAAVGAGISSILLFLALRGIYLIRREAAADENR
ncbi:MAG: DUF4040 domain-containing protein [Firmicutes bacterium]|nr:DUF4040 domain-containing protein [Bacillota bacterium]